jgi:hypothetical protein
VSYRVKSILFWTLSFILMAAAAIYQRSTGPTYPVRGTIMIGDEIVKYRLIRTWEGDTEATIRVKVENSAIEGKFRYKRFRSYDSWSEKLDMKRQGEYLAARLPNLPPAGKMKYEIYLGRDSQFQNLTASPPILRYKGVVPKWSLIPHIIIVFLAMIFSTRAGLEALIKGKNLVNYSFWTVILFGIGGMIFGPIIQKFAFDAYWTGWPFGTDLTDNKSLVTFIMWVIAWLLVRQNPQRRWWVFAAALVLILTYLIPHSMMGSELDFTELEAPRVID